MDDSILSKHIEIVNKHYPEIDLTQLGLVTLYLGLIRATMGHESAIGTIENYIHPEMLSPDVRNCLDYLEREVLGIKRSKIDIDYWKRGNKGEFRRDKDKVQA